MKFGFLLLLIFVTGTLHPASAKKLENKKSEASPHQLTPGSMNSTQYSIASRSILAYIDYTLDLNRERTEEFIDLSLTWQKPDKKSAWSLIFIHETDGQLFSNPGAEYHSYAIDLRQFKYKRSNAHGLYWSYFFRLAHQSGEVQRDLSETGPIESYTRLGAGVGFGYRYNFGKNWYLRTGLRTGRYLGRVHIDRGAYVPTNGIAEIELFVIGYNL